MKILTFKITNTSPLILATGKNDSSYIDNQMDFDELGFPFISARRFKGLLRNSAEQVYSMFKQSSTAYLLPPVSTVFGNGWSESKCIFTNINISRYEENKDFLNKLRLNNELNFSSSDLINTVTTIRQQTSITSYGVTKENSLRTIKVLNSGFQFEGNIQFFNDISIEMFIALSLLNLRHIGLNRTRGFGNIVCEIDNSLSQKCLAELSNGEKYETN